MKDTARNGGGLLLCGKTLLGLGEMEGRQGGSETLAPSLCFWGEMPSMEWERSQQVRKAQPQFLVP